MICLVPQFKFYFLHELLKSMFVDFKVSTLKIQARDYLDPTEKACLKFFVYDFIHAV